MHDDNTSKIDEEIEKYMQSLPLSCQNKPIGVVLSMIRNIYSWIDQMNIRAENNQATYDDITYKKQQHLVKHIMLQIYPGDDKAEALIKFFTHVLKCLEEWKRTGNWTVIVK